MVSPDALPSVPSRSPDVEVSLDMNMRKSHAEHDWNVPFVFFPTSGSTAPLPLCKRAKLGKRRQAC